ncbi:hypothetical protein C9J12_21005 [Photobacterium frigidiphilum]|uniref:Major facilitator superfamily (MFS) profile domain-containing protein n=1 Tax=Photobacterium frigidiphilum TaxID=264736 RepID=A0A2T3JA51_9GAMM|nr:MFS transporter [Photobacterium frigidiphilum]PSU45726.1 hypothetical protein C9J12_21005 [Photobacterium frigidiphilum]
MNKQRRENLLLLGNVADMYDLVIYVALAKYISELFFAEYSTDNSLIIATSIFFISYIARVLGGVLFGYISDRHGRKKSLYLSALLIGSSTIAIAVLPTYQTIGILAPIVFILLRIFQGLAFGGEIPVMITYILENSTRKFISSAKITASSTAGAVLATITNIWLSNTFTHTEILEFYWRVPFLFSFLSIAIALIIRIKAHESEEYLKKKENTDVKEKTFSLGTIVKIAFSIAAGACTFYVINTSISFISDAHNVDLNTIQLICSFFLLMMILIAGVVSQRLENSRISVFKVGLIGLVFLSVPLFFLISQNEIITSILAIITFIVITSMIQANVPLLALELTKFTGRTLNLSIGYNLGIVSFGGSAPYIIHKLSTVSFTSIGLYVSVVSLLSLVTLLLVLPKFGYTRNSVRTELLRN